MFTKSKLKINIIHNFDNSVEEFYNIRVLLKNEKGLLYSFVVKNFL